MAAGEVEPRGNGGGWARLAAFRGELYRCFTARADVLFELADAVLCAGRPVWKRWLGCRWLLSTAAVMGRCMTR